MLKPLAFTVLLALAIFSTTADAQDAPTAQAFASHDAEGVVVRYSLSEPVRRVAFSDHDTIRARWSVTAPGLTLVDGAIIGDQPFDTFELHILPDAAEIDRIYMGLSVAGAGRVLYGPGLLIEGIQVTLSIDPAPGVASLPAENLVRGYSYIGPEEDITTDDRGDLVAGANVPPELVDALRASFFDSMTFYETRLGALQLVRPALIASIDSPGPTMFRGDVTNTGLISVRFYGDAWRQEMETVIPFVWHETFHLWNSRTVQGEEGEHAPWLLEGGADYAAIIGAVTADAMSEAKGRDRIIQGANTCRRVLGDRDFDPARLRSGNGPYACGILIQWIADLEARRTGGDVFTIWKPMLDAARARSTAYGVSDFRGLIGPDSAVSVLLDSPGATRWATIKARLADLGVTLTNRAGDQDLRVAALFHIAAINCRSGSFGFYDNPGEVKLDGADCGVLSGEPIIDTVEGHDPQQASRPMFDAIQARCGESLPVRYATRDGRTLEAVCDKPLVEPEVWAIADAPSLAISDETSRPL